MFRLGDPCWERENIEKTISSIAQLDPSRSHHFLACHSPIVGISDCRTHDIFTEEVLFKKIFSSTHRDSLILVQGDPGTGKSHLIHWLGLRLRNANDAGEYSEVVPVLIQRRSGSLKDALEQMVDQLPSGFQQYLQPVREAIGQISETTARETLAAQLRLELGPRWCERGRSALPHSFRYLPETCASKGFREWLCRTGGVIDSVVKRLTQSSEIEEREELPQFEGKEFSSLSAKYRAENLASVIALIDDFADEAKLSSDAAGYFNEALPHAIREMTGLSGTRLRDIFDHIRRDLRSQQKTLALFIEDVSVMSALDEEVVNAVEPQSRKDLCRTVAILGVTNAGMKRLPENQRQRATLIVSVDGAVTRGWESEPEKINAFAARYLNAVRLKEQRVKEIAKKRQQSGADVEFSACDNCQIRDKCHELFGNVNLDGIDIGLFPFSRVALQRLFVSLDEQAQGVRKNPRGLLMQIVHPILNESDALSERRFPRMNLAVKPNELTFWAGFVARYCGHWSSVDRGRLNQFAQSWMESTNAETLAQDLSSFLEPLGFPSLSITPPAPPPPKKGPEPPAPPPPPPPPRSSTEMKRLLANLSAWLTGSELIDDVEVRSLLADFLRKSIAWDDKFYPPLDEWKRLTSGYAFIRIEGMRSRPAAQSFFIDFDRTDETRDLIEALGQFEHTGRKSWQFEHAEHHKRQLSSWLRKHQESIIQKLQPDDKLVNSTKPLQFATQVLVTTFLTKKHQPLPEPAAPAIRELFCEWDETIPVALSKGWKTALEVMFKNRNEVKAFLFRELNVCQGRQGLNCINPIILLKTSRQFMLEPCFDGLDDAYFKNYWTTRYAGLRALQKLPQLEGLLEEEREAIVAKIAGLKKILTGEGSKTANVAQAIREFCSGLTNLLDVQHEAGLLLPDQEFDVLREGNVFVERVDKWEQSLDNAEAVTRSDNRVGIITYDPEPLIDAHECISAAVKYVNRLEGEIDKMIRVLRGTGDPKELQKSLLAVLESIAKQKG